MTGSEERFLEAMELGHSAAWELDWDQAAHYYRQALQEIPGHPSALTNLGLALYEQQKYEESLDCYRRAASSSPGDPLPQEKIAQLLERLGDLPQAQLSALQAAELYMKARELDKAIEDWEWVIRINPLNKHAHVRLAMVFERLGQKKEAVREYLAIASLFQRSNAIDKAVSAVQHALQILPQSAEANSALVTLQSAKPLPLPSHPRDKTAPMSRSQNGLNEVASPGITSSQVASHATSRLYELDPVGEATEQALAILAGMLFEDGVEVDVPSESRQGLGALMRGAERFTPRKADRGRFMLHLARTLELKTQGDLAQSASELERAVAAGLNHPAAHYYLGHLLFEQKRYDSALRSLERAVKSPPFALSSRLLMGQIFLNRGRLKESAHEYLNALHLAEIQVLPGEITPELDQRYAALIEAQGQSIDENINQRLCTSVQDLLIRPGWRSHLQSVRQQLLDGGDDRSPVPVGEILIQGHGNRLVESLAEIKRLVDAGHLPAAVEEAFFALDHAPGYLPLHVSIAELLLQGGLVQDAVLKLLVVAQSYAMRGETQQAIDLFQRTAKLAPLDPTPHRYLSEHYRSLGQIENVLQEQITLADIYYNLADRPTAVKTLNEALRLAQRSHSGIELQVEILHRLADMDVQGLEWRQALKVYEQIIAINPGDERARSHIIELNFRLGQEARAKEEIDAFATYLVEREGPNVAIEFLEALIVEYPKQTFIHQRLAELYRQDGQSAKAVAQLGTLVELQLDEGDRPAAAQTVQAILALNPPNPEEYRMLLSQLRGRIIQ